MATVEPKTSLSGGDVLEIRKAANSRGVKTALAARFGISVRTVSQIRSGATGSANDGAVVRRPGPPFITKRFLRSFWGRVDFASGSRSARGRCWLWTGGSDAAGNPWTSVRWYYDGPLETVSACRVAYMLANGAIPNGRHVERICQQRLCVNPEHIRLRRYDGVEELRNDKPRVIARMAMLAACGTPMSYIRSCCDLTETEAAELKQQSRWYAQQWGFNLGHMRTTADNECLQFNRESREEVRLQVESLISQLPSRCRDAVCGAFGLSPNGPCTLAATARKWKVTRERVRQIRLLAVNKLRGLAVTSNRAVT